MRSRKERSSGTVRGWIGDQRYDKTAGRWDGRSYEAGGAIGGAVAQAFAREGAQAFLTGRRLAPLERVVTEIKQAGGAARIAQVDTLDEAATERHRDQIVEEFRGVMSPSLPFTESKTV